MVDPRRAIRQEHPVQEAPREWLVANGLGGYASATITGAVTRRYHGFLIAAQPAPLGRMVVLNDLEVDVELADGSIVNMREKGRFVDFTLNMGLPSWRYELDGVVIETSIVMPSRQNIVHSTFRSLSAGRRNRLRVRPLINFRALETQVSEALPSGYTLTIQGDRYEINAGSDLPILRLAVEGAEGPTFTADGGSRREHFYDVEAQRGYDSRGWLWSPGYFSGEVRGDCPLTLIAATEAWHTVRALSPDDALTFESERRRRLVGVAAVPAQIGFADELILAADTFVISPVGRIADGARARAEGDEIRTVIAGYHWFTDWGRDTMISLEGLTLSTGRAIEARWILRTFAHYVRDGLIPNLFPEGQNLGLYHTADATLWFFHALHRYVEHSGDKATLALLLPILKDIVRHHLEGTRFGIKVDPHDGLLTQGAEGYAADLDGCEGRRLGGDAAPRQGGRDQRALVQRASLVGRLAAGSAEPGSRRARSPCGQDARFLQSPLLACGRRLSLRRRRRRERRRRCVSTQPDLCDFTGASGPRPRTLGGCCYCSARKLVTPVGLRSLAPGEPDYKPRYFGDLRARDAAYHQGTVWAWLIGPFIDAWLRVAPR